MRSYRLPEALRTALEREEGRIAFGELAAAAKKLSAGYQAGGTQRLGNAERLAYLHIRMPVTLAAAVTALGEVPFPAESFLELGAGPATGAWAAQEALAGIRRFTLVEREHEWRVLAGRMEAPEAEWVFGDLRSLPELEAHDVVLVNYALNELQEMERRRLVRAAWELAGRALVLVEPGTPEGFTNLRDARRALIEAGARIAAPCPHNGMCPVEHPDWCHFAVRVERTRLHRRLKGGELGYEDEKFSYVIACREKPEQDWRRILRHPRVEPGLLTFPVCGDSGIEQVKVPKRAGEEWRRARKASWGDRWPL
jgi:ribosomal protein RSM22 (predicted rRNA methylase)